MPRRKSAQYEPTEYEHIIAYMFALLDDYPPLTFKRDTDCTWHLSRFVEEMRRVAVGGLDGKKITKKNAERLITFAAILEDAIQRIVAKTDVVEQCNKANENLREARETIDYLVKEQMSTMTIFRRCVDENQRMRRVTENEKIGRLE